MQKARYIIHVDMDAFFAAIEQRDNSEFRNKPVIVGAQPKGGHGRGVVSTCSYEARKFGIHSAMPISIAYRRCPHAIFLPVDMDKYNRVSREIYEILYEFTPKVEPVSIDEAFLDITSSYHIFGTPKETGKLIKQRIKEILQLTASLGLASTKMAAKTASDLNKPDGLVEVKQESLLDFLSPLDIDKICGLGKKTKVVLNNMGIKTISHLAKRDIKELTAIFGKNGEHFWKLANGIDEREVKAPEEAKSISNEITFSKDTLDKQKIEGALLALSELVSARLRKDNLKGRTISLKVRFQGFCTHTRAVTLTKATNFVDVIYETIKKLYGNFKGDNRKVRLVGVKVSSLISADFPDTFFNDDIDQKRERLHQAVNKINEKFGNKAICRVGAKMYNGAGV